MNREISVQGSKRLVTPATTSSQARCAGHTLLELLIVIAIIAIVAALTVARFAGRDDAARLGQDVANRVRERRAAAIQLNALETTTQLENFTQPPVTIDFTNLSTTASLNINGTDANNDGVDDTTGLALTRFLPPQAPGGMGSWSYAYQGSPLSLPLGWRVATSSSDLAPVPPIALGTPTTLISFGADGQVVTPAVTSSSPPDPNQETPFPVIYLTNGTDAWAVAVHVTGPEVWQWDKTASVWRGFGGRTLPAGG